MDDRYTIGVEEEFQLVDADTGALRSRASDVLSTDWSDDIQGELHETTVEIATRICANMDEIRKELSRCRFQVATAAAAEGLEVAAAGIHPFSGWDGHAMHPGERYDRIHEKHERVAREVNIFGMHIHVGVPEDVDRLVVIDRVRAFIPHLLALSCSSPFQNAEDTGFASYRSVLWRQYPYTGIPPRFENDEEYQRFLGLLLRSGSVQDKGNVYWSVRPHFSYPTIEFRATDACPRMEDAVAVAGLARLLVVAVAEGGLEVEGSDLLPPELWRVILTENEWHVARYGLDAFLTDPAAVSSRTPVRSAIRRLLDHLAPVAEELGETSILDGIEQLLQRGNGADRMRVVHRESDSFDEVVRWMVRETRLNTGFDRRRTQRAGTG